MLNYIREGDILVVYSLDRLARSLKDLLNITEILRNKNVRLISISENQDTSNDSGEIFMQLFGVLFGVFADYQIRLIRSRQVEGIALAKLKGLYKGRKKISKPIIYVIKNILLIENINFHNLLLRLN